MPSNPTRSAGVVPVREIDGEAHFLLLRCYGYWDFPKGEIENGEDPLQTAVREVREETDLTGLDFRWGHIYTETEPYGRGKVARYYLAAAPEGDVTLLINPELGRPEHHECRWLTAGEAEPLLNDRLRRVLNWSLAQLR
ncbi:MAG: NUDIX domain-containing protein [Thiohalocapsa sp.]|nr:NUDIX domain-containing protein [Thiohalocapsa sp.]MCF7990026.1 NUDIX domain-containing protein [Thiohalocapsa sp.]